jgi:hypothetical protein
MDSDFVITAYYKLMMGVRQLLDKLTIVLKGGNISNN